MACVCVCDAALLDLFFPLFSSFLLSLFSSLTLSLSRAPSLSLSNSVGICDCWLKGSVQKVVNKGFVQQLHSGRARERTALREPARVNKPSPLFVGHLCPSSVIVACLESLPQQSSLSGLSDKQPLCLRLSRPLSMCHT